MNNYYYGKSGQGDYKVSDMPQNRLQLFGAVFKVRWSSMFGVNLLHMLFWLPTYIWSIIHIIMLFSADEIITTENAASYFMTYLIGLIPCIGITGPFTAGTSYVMRNWARDEHSFVWSDFWDAVKGNWKQGLGVSIISGCMPLLLYVGWVFYGQLSSDNAFFIIPMVLVLLIAIIWSLTCMIIYTMMVTYELSFKDLVRNSVILTMAKLPQAIGIKLLTLAVPIICVALMFIVPSIQLYVIMILALLILLYLPSFNRLILASYSNALCEKYLNPKIEGAQTNIGLRPEDWDDTEYIPQDDED